MFEHDLPNDAGLPMLAEVGCETAWSDRLGEVPLFEGACARPTRVRVLKHHPANRCTFELLVEHQRCTHELIGKLYAADRSDVLKDMSLLYGGVFGGDSPFGIPQPLAYFPDIQLLLQSKARGQMATEIFLHGDRQKKTQAAEKCAHWLAALHNSNASVGHPPRRRGLVESFERWPQIISRAGEPLGGKASRLATALSEAMNYRVPVRPCITHDDYVHHQIIFDNGRTITCDFDRIGMADPGVDLAEFIVVLQYLALLNGMSVTFFQDEIDAFLQSYFLTGRADAFLNLRFYRAASCLQHAKNDVKHGRFQDADIVLEEGLRLLGVVSGRRWIAGGDSVAGCLSTYASRGDASVQGAHTHDTGMQNSLPNAEGRKDAIPVIPVDTRIPTLAQATDEEALRRCIESIGIPLTKAGRIRLRLLKHHVASRCTFQIEADGVEGREYLIGKVFASDRPDIHQGMIKLRAAGFGSDSAFRIPRSLAYIAPLQLQIQEKVDAKQLKHVLLDGKAAEREAACVRAALWLARFQALAPPAAGVFGVSEQMELLEHLMLRIRDAGEYLAGKAQMLFELLQQAGKELSPAELSPGHGSYAYGQVLIGEESTVVVDWDGYDTADPSRDVGRFIASLHKLAFKDLGSIRALDKEALVFLDTYTNAMGTKRLVNLPFYCAAAYLKLAKYEVNRRAARRPDYMEAVLDEGIRVIHAREISLSLC